MEVCGMDEPDWYGAGLMGPGDISDNAPDLLVVSL
jgi:hypothetical protein